MGIEPDWQSQTGNWAPDQLPKTGGPPPRTVPWSMGDVFAIVGLVVSVFFLLAALVGFLFQISTVIRPANSLEDPLRSPLGTSFFWMLQWGVTMGVAFTYLKLRGYQLSLSVLGFRKTGVGHAALLTFGVLVGAFFFQAIYVTYVVEPTQEPVTGLFGTSLPGFILAMLIVAIFTPVLEELFFRGIIHQGLEQRLGFLPAAAISSFIWSLAHLDPTVYLPIFVLGIGFAGLMSRTKSLWPSIIAHFLWNSLGVVAQFFGQ